MGLGFYGYGLEFDFLSFTRCTLLGQRWGAESDQLINESMILPYTSKLNSRAPYVSSCCRGDLTLILLDASLLFF